MDSLQPRIVSSSLVDISGDGEFKRKAAMFRQSVKLDGVSEFVPEAGRYHLYVSLACPWANRTLICRNLKGLEHAIGVSVVDYYMGEEGWRFKNADEVSGCIPDTVHNFSHVSQLYHHVAPEYHGRYTVPVLYDKQTQRIVNNESSEIIRMLNSEFNNIAKNPKLDLYPTKLQAQIDELNAWIYDEINNGVYKTGFATTQSAYEKSFDTLFQALDRVEAILSKSTFLCGDHLTEADVRLFTTLIRFDPVYFGHFKCNRQRIEDFPHMWRYVRQLFHIPEFQETVNFEHIKKHYYMSHHQINPRGIVPKGPEMHLELQPSLHLVRVSDEHGRLTGITVPDNYFQLQNMRNEIGP
jgi:putative glutathione S-transferase